MTVREMIGFDEAEIKTETEAAKNRVRKLMDDINEMPAGKAEKTARITNRKTKMTARDAKTCLLYSVNLMNAR